MWRAWECTKPRLISPGWWSAPKRARMWSSSATASLWYGWFLSVEELRSLASVRGAWRGRVQMADDFDELPDDIAEAFGAR